MFVTNWISTTKIQKISEITNFFRHYFLSRTEVIISGHASGADALIAFWDGKSRGTKNMIDTATKQGLKVAVVRY